MELSTIDVSKPDLGVLRPFSLMKSGDQVAVDLDGEDMKALRDTELEWARSAGIDMSRLVEVVAGTQTCIQTVTGIEPNTDNQLDCAVDESPNDPIPA
ncbi:MAG: hypothetical protein ACRDZO_02430 [Egibacteraceae bacterium]